jgi:hypothetical protein
MDTSISTKQKSTIARIEKVDASATHREVEGVVLISYVPRWERGRMVSGTYNENPNPTRITHAVTLDGKLHGWGYGPIKVKLPAAVLAEVTTPEQMAEVLKTRSELRSPKPEQPEATEEAKPEPEAKPNRRRKTATAKKSTRTRRSGVQVTK